MPYTDLLPDYRIAAKPAVLYVPDTCGTADLMTYVPSYVPDGVLNAHENIYYRIVDEDGNTVNEKTIPAGKRAEDCGWKEETAVRDRCGTYRVVCVLIPSAESTRNTLTLEEKAEVHVYRPAVLFKDSLVKQGDPVDTGLGEKLSAQDFGTHFGVLRWTCSCGTRPSVSAEEPELFYAAAALSGTVMQGGRVLAGDAPEIPVVVRVYRKTGEKTADLTGETTFGHLCEAVEKCSFEKEYSRHAHFLIHTVKPAEPAAPAAPVQTEDPAPEPVQEKQPEPAVQTPAPAPAPVKETSPTAAETPAGPVVPKTGELVEYRRSGGIIAGALAVILLWFAARGR